MRCKICNKEFKKGEPIMYIESITGCCIDCIRLFSEKDDDDDNEDYLTEHPFFRNKSGD